MKKNHKIRFTLAILLAMLLGTANVQAVNYSLWIAGVQVTDVNKGDLTVINGTNGHTVTGAISYNSDTQTLRLEDATISVTGDVNGIRSGLNGLKIEVVGNNSITSNGWCAIHIEQPGTITGSGTLSTSNAAADNYAIFVLNTSLTIKDCTLSATGGKRGITGYSGSETLIINNATVTATGTGEGSIMNFGNINLVSCSIFSPDGAKISGGSVMDASGSNIITEEVTIKNVSYNLQIAGAQVTDANKDDLTVIPGVSGTSVTYNPGTQTLTLNGATISIAGDVNAILSDTDDLKVNVIGNNTVTSNGWTAIIFNQTGTITGSGTLTVNNQTNDAIFVAGLGASLTIKDCTLSATSGVCGITGGDGSETLTIDNATVTATGSTWGSIAYFSDINLVGCSIISPDGATTTGGSVTDASGTVLKTKVKIVPTASYDLWICGVQVAGANKDDLSVISGVSGTSVTYNPNTQTLTLNGATISTTTTDDAIFSGIDGLKINVIGNNTVTINGWTTIRFSNSSTIMGSGTLTVNNQANDIAISVNGSGASLTIKDCTLSVTGGWGIVGNGNGETLTIDNATVTATGTSVGSIAYFSDINLVGCSIFSPDGAKISGGSVMNASGSSVIKDEVKIKNVSYNLWIGGVQVTDANKDDLKVISGVSGTSVTYNSENQTLTLNRANISIAGDVNAIRSEIDDLKVNLIGNNTVTSNGWAAIKFSQTGTIMGSGTLTVNNQAEDYAIFANADASLTIKDCTVSATASKRGITGNGGNETLNINNATVTATGTGEGSIVGFNSIDLVSCSLFSPQGAQIADGAVRNTTDGNVITGEVKIKNVSYNLQIAGVQVTDANKNDLSTGNPCVTAGAISYDSDTQTLTLNDASISVTGQVNGIRSTLNGLKINVVGSNNITANDWCAIHIEQPGTILGSGTLSASNSKANDLAIFVYNTSLVIQDCTVSATADGRGITGYNNGGTLTINNATVTAKGTNGGSITHFSSINLNGCSVFSPSGAKVSGGKVTDASGTHVITEEVTIKNVSYNLQIAGVQVTDVNKNDLSTSNPCVTAGAISYDSDSKTLTLNNASISVTGEVNGIRSALNGLKIEVVGDNNITSNGWAAIHIEQPGTIMGSDTLTVYNQAEDHAIFAESGASLTIEDCTLSATGGGCGIAGNGDGETLTINNATVTATGTSVGSITGFSDITLTGCFISEPAGAVFNDSQNAICKPDSSIVKTQVKIIPLISYDLYICGVQVTNANCGDLSVINGTNDCIITGSITYNPDSKTLKLENSNITLSGGFRTILSQIEGLIIEIVGNNNINANSSFSPVESYKQTTILGGGTLTINNQDIYAPIYIGSVGASLTIENCTLNVTCGGYGISSDYHGTLTIKNATVTATGSTSGSIINFSSISLVGCSIISPAGAKTSSGSVTNASGNVIKDEVRIIPIYDLWICGTQVTSTNKNDLSVIDGVSGTVTYDPGTQTLTFNGATITDDVNAIAINSNINGLKVEVIGNNTVTITSDGGWAAIQFNQPATIMGSGTLNASSPADADNYAILTNAGASLTIEDCTLSATGGGCGIAGSGGSETLTIDNATVTATGTSVGSIYGFSSISLVGCFISEPADAVFNPEIRAICSSGTIVKTQVNIEKDLPTGIDKPDTHGLSLYPNPVNDILHIQAEKAVTAVRIYDINGTAVAQDMGENISEIKLAHLPAGIYMVRVETGEGVNTMRIIKQ